MKRTVAVIFLIAVMICAAFAAETNSIRDRLLSTSEVNAKVRQLVIAQTQCEAIGAMITLTGLRAGETNTVLETLEFQLDSAVVSSRHQCQGGTEELKN